MTLKRMRRLRNWLTVWKEVSETVYCVKQHFIITIFKTHLKTWHILPPVLFLGGMLIVTGVLLTRWMGYYDLGLGQLEGGELTYLAIFWILVNLLYWFLESWSSRWRGLPEPETGTRRSLLPCGWNQVGLDLFILIIWLLLIERLIFRALQLHLMEASAVLLDMIPEVMIRRWGHAFFWKYWSNVSMLV